MKWFFLTMFITFTSYVVWDTFHNIMITALHFGMWAVALALTVGREA